MENLDHIINQLIKRPRSEREEIAKMLVEDLPENRSNTIPKISVMGLPLVPSPAASTKQTESLLSALDHDAFTAIWLSESHFLDQVGVSDPILGMYQVLNQTTHVSLRSQFKLALTHPIQVAEKLAQMAQLFPERVGGVFSKSISPREKVLESRDVSAVETFYSDISEITRLLHGESFEYISPNQDSHVIRVSESGVSVPTWVAVNSEEMAQQAGQNGFNIVLDALELSPDQISLFIQSYKQARLCLDTAEIALIIPTLLQTDSVSAISKSKPLLAQFLKENIQSGSDGLSSFQISQLLKYSLDQYIETRTLIGSSESVKNQLMGWASLGVTEIVCHMGFDLDADTFLESISELSLLSKNKSDESSSPISQDKAFVTLPEKGIVTLPEAMIDEAPIVVEEQNEKPGIQSSSYPSDLSPIRPFTNLTLTPKVTAPNIHVFQPKPPVKLADSDKIQMIVEDRVSAKPSVGALLQYPSWEKSKDILKKSDVGTRTVMVLSQYETFSTQLSELGFKKVIWVRPGMGFRAISKTQFQIDVKSENDYRLLMHHLGKTNDLPDFVLQVWSVSPAPTMMFGNMPDRILFEKTLALEVATLKNFSSVLAGFRSQPELKWLVMIVDGDRKMAPVFEVASTFLQSLSSELDKIHIQSVWLQDHQDFGEIVLKEIDDTPGSDYGVLWNKDGRFIRAIKSWTPQPSNADLFPIPKGGAVWLINAHHTAGKEMAKWLNAQYGAKIILSTSSELTVEDKQMWRSLLKHPEDFLWLPIQATQLESLYAVRQQILAQFTALNGVVYFDLDHVKTALSGLSLNQIESFMQDHIKPVLALDQVTLKDELSFFLTMVPTLENSLSWTKGFCEGFSNYRAHMLQKKQRYGASLTFEYPEKETSDTQWHRLFETIEHFIHHTPSYSFWGL